jgi:6-phosphogluconolactonase/glucosamine-6-phosphate isomerase/deaminase
MNNVFDHEKIKKRMRELEDMPPFKPEPDELRFTVTQTFDTHDVTMFFVVRDGHMLFYNPNDTR